jgi:hypothetical protein
VGPICHTSSTRESAARVATWMESPGGPKGEIRGPGKLSPFLLFLFSVFFYS